MSEKGYTGENIKVLDNLGEIRKKFDIIELRRKVKKHGDIFILSQEIHVKPYVLQHAVEEARILSFFPNIHKSKANALSRIRTDRELMKFAELNDINFLSARKLYESVKKWNFDLANNPRILLTQEEHDLVLGSLLGDASVRQREKNSCFRFTHSTKQRLYAQWKHDILKNFKISEFREVKRKVKDHIIEAMDFATNTHPAFNYYRNLFYKNGRKIITQEILDQLNPSSLAVWVCDDGSYSRTQGYIILCTNAYSLEEHNLMKKFFNNKFGLDPTIGFRDGKYYYLRFKQDDTKKLVKIIKPYLLSSMKYKIGEENGI
ncbi:MAG: LAGLIDADG endonuclease [Nanoarchaeota archaeon]